MSHPPCCTPPVRRARWILIAALIGGALLLPLLARSQDLEGQAGYVELAKPAGEVVAEALFLCDPLPPGGRDLNLILAVQQGDPDPATGVAPLVANPRLQLALGLGERVGLTADVGVGSSQGGSLLTDPAASLKFLLRAPDAATTGLAASLDLFGSSSAVGQSEAGFTLGALRALGRFALRAGVGAATSVSTWSPHLHGGVSAALALGPRWRVLAEVVAEVAGGTATVSSGPTLKVLLGEGTALMAGALFGLTQGTAMPVVTVQLTRSM